MLDNTLTLTGVEPDRDYVRRHDAENRSHYTVGGLPASQEQSLTVSHQIQKNKSRRTLIDLTDTLPVPGTTTGATYQDRVYLVIQRGQFTDLATITNMVSGMAGLMADTAMEAILDGDV